jgi:hypothetical protein
MTPRGHYLVVHVFQALRLHACSRHFQKHADTCLLQQQLQRRLHEMMVFADI